MRPKNHSVSKAFIWSKSGSICGQYPMLCCVTEPDRSEPLMYAHPEVGSASPVRIDKAVDLPSYVMYTEIFIVSKKSLLYMHI